MEYVGTITTWELLHKIFHYDRITLPTAFDAYTS